MSKAKKSTIKVLGADVAVLSQSQQDIICLTDIAKFKKPDHPDDVIRNWLRNRNTVEFLGIWEGLNNPSFNPVEFDGIRMQTGLNTGHRLRVRFLAMPAVRPNPRSKGIACASTPRRSHTRNPRRASKGEPDYVSPTSSALAGDPQTKVALRARNRTLRPQKTPRGDAPWV